MLSDKEKKALERIDYIQDFIIENGQYNADVGDMQYFSRVLNLIEKQSKEIEELKEEKGYHLGFIDGGIAKRYEMENKIKAKIEEVKDGIYDAKIVLQSLLEKE